MIARIIGFLILSGALVALLILSQREEEGLRVSGFIEADEIRVGSRVGGRVQRVAVEEGQRVAKGDLLVQLEPFDLLQRRAEAQGNLAQRKSALDRMVAGFREEEIAQAKARHDQIKAHLSKLQNGPRKQEIAVAEAELELAKSNLELARLDYQRVESLYARQAATQESMDEAETELKAARSSVRVREERLALLKEGTRIEEIEQAQAELEEAAEAWKLKRNGYRGEEVAEANAAVKSAEAALEAIERQIDELKIVSPVEGTVEAVELQPGDLVAPNAPAISLMDTRQMWVRAYVPENRLDLEIGREVRVTVDSYPGRDFTGRISFIARQAEFTPTNVQTPEERSKQVFRIKVMLTGERANLRPGMAADVWLHDADQQR